jgi:membrane-associated phospholipid phosphatase
MVYNIYLFLMFIYFKVAEMLEPYKVGLEQIYEQTNRFLVRWQKQFVPILLVVLGSVGTGSDWMGYENRQIRDELQANVPAKVTIDNYTQFAPLAAVYVLDACQMTSRCTFGQQLAVTAVSVAIQETVVTTLKTTTHIQRPDHTAHNSFPSGHTTMAFVGAELLSQEYAGSCPWVAILGYVVAAATGFLRMYNNRHWLTDVVAGAGLGILIVRLAYWLCAYVQKRYSMHSHRCA